MLLDLDAAVKALHDGLVLGIPTETFYGLGVDLRHPAAIASVLSLKRRPQSQPSPVLVASPEGCASLLSRPVPNAALLLMERFWPGGLTIVLDGALPSLPPQIVSHGTIALRRDGHPDLMALFEASKVPAMTGTSANLTGDPPIREGHLVSSLFSGEPGYAGHIGVGPTRGLLPSTILDMSVHPPALLRLGPVSVAEIEETLGLTLATSR